MDQHSLEQADDAPKDLFEGLPGPPTKVHSFFTVPQGVGRVGFKCPVRNEHQITSTKVFSVSAPWAMKSLIYRPFTKIKTVISAAELLSVAKMKSVAFFSKKETL